MSDPSFAEVVVRALEARDDLDVFDLFNRASSYVDLARYAEAVEDYDRVVALDPDFEAGMVWYHRGNALHALGRLDDAAASYEQAIELEVDECGPYFNAAGVYMQLAQPAEALRALDAYVATAPQAHFYGAEPGEAHVRRAMVLEELGRSDDADAAFMQALAAEPEMRSALLTRRGDFLAYRRRDFVGAQSDFEASMALEPEHRAWFEVRVALMLAARGEHEAARESYRRAADLREAREYVVEYAAELGLSDVLAALLRPREADAGADLDEVDPETPAT